MLKTPVKSFPPLNRVLPILTFFSGAVCARAQSKGNGWSGLFIDVDDS